MRLKYWVMLIIGSVLGGLGVWWAGRKTSEQLRAEVARLNTSLQTAADAQRLSKELPAAATKPIAAETAARVQELETELKSCRAARDALEQQLVATQEEAARRIGVLEAAAAASAADLAAAQQRQQDLAAHSTEPGSARASALVVPARAEESAARTAVIDLGQATSAEESAAIDDLTKIRGVGPTYASRLAAAGIHSYADLATADPDELEKAVGVKEWQQVDTRAWIAEAAALAARPRQVQVGDDLTRLEGIGPTYARRLRAAGITTFAQLAAADEATLSEIIGAPAWRQPNFGDWITQAQLAAAGDEAGLKALQDVLFSRKGDNLALIAGLGDTGVEVLKGGGITSFAALADATPEQLDELFAKADARGGDSAAWIAEAQLRAAGKRIARPTARTRSRSGALLDAQLRSCPQDLEQIQGIGRVYEQRLYAAGIGTFWEVGMVPPDELKTILGIQEFQDVDLAAIQADALRLAQETDAMGETWDGSEPDDFDELEGIGPVLERRLYAAGICTYEELAQTARERLVEICKAPSFNRPDYDKWIEVAQARVRARHA
jgi:predicted flap endonuclease-1-like 5' DNA nuclease